MTVTVIKTSEVRVGRGVENTVEMDRQCVSNMETAQLR